MGLLTHAQNTQAVSPKLTPSRHEGLLLEFLEQVDTLPGRDRSGHRITIIARSPASPVVAAFTTRVRDLKMRNIMAQIIVAHLDPESALRDMSAALSLLADDDDIGDLVRWARNPCILDAHEQLTLGHDMCWSGDAMRREPGKRDSLDLFERDAPHTVRLGALAFDAIWSASVPVPASRLGAGSPARTAAMAQRTRTPLPNPSFLRVGKSSAITRH